MGRLLVSLGTILPGVVFCCQWETYCQVLSLSVSEKHTARGRLLVSVGTTLPGVVS